MFLASGDYHLEYTMALATATGQVDAGNYANSPTPLYDALWDTLDNTYDQSNPADIIYLQRLAWGLPIFPKTLLSLLSCLDSSTRGQGNCCRQ